MDKQKQKKAANRTGLIILVALIVLEAFDFLAAQLTGGSITILFVLALINAALIVQYYMHVQAVFTEEEGH